MERKLYSFIILLISFTINSQNTVGTIMNTPNALNGYTLFTSLKETYLINNCGEVVHQWTSDYNSGKSVYLLENGNLLRTAQIPNPGNLAIPGIGGRLELFNWNGNLIWEYEYSTNTVSQHHDIFPLPNGNILMLAATKINGADAIQMGRNPANLTGSVLYNEQVVEIEPVGSNNATIIWQWDIKDHLIQDFDNTKDNYGIVGDNPQRLDINYLGISNGGSNWLHINSIQYNPQLDQIILSSRMLNELYIIDHSTTTAQATTSTGGTYGKGGDILYRWGNPLAYRQGVSSDQKFFGQHYPHWIADGFVDADKIIVFNNGFGRSLAYSEIDIISPPSSSPGFYTYSPNTSYLPFAADILYTAPVKTDFYSPILSSAQRISNGNTLICEGTSGHFFEIDSNNDIVWEYINPIGPSEILNQGDDPEPINNAIFRAKKYATNYPAFNGKDLTPGLPIEGNPDLSQCTILSVSEANLFDSSVYPNPVQQILNINSDTTIYKVEFYNQLGALIKTSFNTNRIDISELNQGIYLIKSFSDGKLSFNKIIKI